MNKAIVSFLGVWVLVCANFITTGTSSAAHVTSIDPEDGAKNVQVDTWIVIQFNTSMDKSSVVDNLDIKPSLEPYGYRTEWDEEGTELTIKPNAALVYSRNYTITIEGGEDVSGYPLEDTLIYFETESESETLMGSNSEIPGFLILMIFFLIFLVIVAFLLGFWIFGKKI
jgi:hypothetical protein